MGFLLRWNYEGYSDHLTNKGNIMKAKALWVTPKTYDKYVSAVKTCEGHTVYPLFQVTNTYLVVRDYSEDGLDNRDCTTYPYNSFHSNFWMLDAHSYVDFFEVEHV